MNNILKDLTIQDFLAVVVSCGVFALILCKYAVPDQIWSGWMVIITFFFNQPKNGGSNVQIPTIITDGTVITKSGGGPGDISK